MMNVYNVCYFLKKGNADWVKVYWRNRNGVFIMAGSKAEAVDIAMSTIKTNVKENGGAVVGRQVTNFQTVDADGTTRTYSNFMAIKMYVDKPAVHVDDDVDDDKDEDVDDDYDCDDYDEGDDDEVDDVNSTEDDVKDETPTNTSAEQQPAAPKVYTPNIETTDTDDGYEITIHVRRPQSISVDNVTRADGGDK